MNKIITYDEPEGYAEMMARREEMTHKGQKIRQTEHNIRRMEAVRSEEQAKVHSLE